MRYVKTIALVQCLVSDCQVLVHDTDSIDYLQYLLLVNVMSSETSVIRLYHYELNNLKYSE